jgi:hypothetical protein
MISNGYSLVEKPDVRSESIVVEAAMQEREIDFREIDQPIG